MKPLFLLLMAFVAGLCTKVQAQQPEMQPTDTLQQYEMPAFLTEPLPELHLMPLDFMDLRGMGNRYEFRIEPFKPKYAVSMSAVLLNKNLPKYVMVFDGKTAARIAHGHIGISNGQAQNWSLYPDGYLNAQTLSFPAPRR